MKTQLTILAAFLSLSARAVDVTGTWHAQFDSAIGWQQYTFTFMQDGRKVALPDFRGEGAQG